MKYSFSWLIPSLNTTSLTEIEKLNRTLTDSASIHKWYFLPKAFISSKSVLSYFNFYVICTFNRKYWNKLLPLGNMTSVWNPFDLLIHIYLPDVPHFDSLLLLNIFLDRFLLVFCLAWDHVSCCLLVRGTGKANSFLYFQMMCYSLL